MSRIGRGERATRKRARVAGSLGGVLALFVVTTAVVLPVSTIGSARVAAMSSAAAQAAPNRVEARTVEAAAVTGKRHTAKPVRDTVKAKPVRAKAASKTRSQVTTQAKGPGQAAGGGRPVGHGSAAPAAVLQPR